MRDKSSSVVPVEPQRGKAASDAGSAPLPAISLDTLLNSVPANVAVLNRAGVIVAANDAWNEFARANGASADSNLGVGADYLAACRKSAAAGDTLAGAALAGIQAVLAGDQQRFTQEYPCHSPTQERWFLMTASTLERGQGALVTHLNITERRRAEESEERLQTLMDHNPSLIFLKDERGRYVYLNAAYERQFVHSKDWSGRTDYDFWPRKTAELFRANDVEVLKSGQTQQFLEDSTDLAGRRYCWFCYKFPFTDARGQRYVGGIRIDATARVLAEEPLQKNEERLRAFFNATSDVLTRTRVAVRNRRIESSANP